MNKEQIKSFIGQKTLTVVDAMEKIDANSCGVLFIVDDAGELQGCVTDGDIRRWLINAGKLDAPVPMAMNREPKYLPERDRYDAMKVMKEKCITAIPIVDNGKHIIDIVVMNEKSRTLSGKDTGNLSKVPVVVMAGGKGTRLYPFTKILPKPLIPIGETPIVERIMNCFAEYGIKKFYMTVNYKKGMIRSYFNDLNPDYEIRYVEEDKPLGTGGSIKLITDKFDGPVFVTNCDTLILADYADIYDYHVKSGNVLTVVAALKNITVPYGVIQSGENGELEQMVEKPRLSYFINTGMYIVNPEAIELIPENTMFHMTELVEKAVQSGGRVGIYPVSENSFLDMGEFGEMKRMEEKLNIISET